jgi:TolB-like protein
MRNGSAKSARSEKHETPGTAPDGVQDWHEPGVGETLALWEFYVRPDVEPASKEKMAYSLPDNPSIAVLPFVNMSGDPKQEYLRDGITESIITAVSKIHNLFVIARNSTFAYKGKAVNIQQVARELGVQYVLEGSVQRSVDRLRVTPQLISGRHHHGDPAGHAGQAHAGTASAARKTPQKHRVGHEGL